MPEYTENYGLTLPLKTENYDLDHMTDSMKIIDTELKRVDDKAQEVEQDLTQHKLDYVEHRSQDQLKVVEIEEQVDEIKDDFESHKNDYATYKDSTTLKVAKVEKELNDYKATMQQVNINQEPKQKATGYGVISLPPNAAEGQIGVVVKGNTEVDELGNVKSTISAMRLKSVGKNLFDGVIGQGSISATTGLDVPADGSYRTQNYIKVEKGQTYSLNLLTPVSERSIAYYDNNKNFIIREPVGTTFTPQQDGYVRLRFYSETIPVNEESKLMINKGTTPLPYEPYTESTQYITAKDDEGKIVELRSLPNGTKDEVRLSDGKLIKRVSDEVILNGLLAIDQLIDATETYRFRSSNWCVDKNVLQGVNYTGMGYSSDGNYSVRRNPEITDVYTKQICFSNNNIYVYIEKSKVDAMIGASIIDKIKTYLNQHPITLIYQLENPVEIPIQVSGSIVSYPSGTIYIERILPDAGVYTDKISILHQNAPIKRLDRLSKVDFYTGVETELDVSEAVIAEDKLSFTHPELSAGDIVFFEYEYDIESTEGETEVEYYDSRYVIKDSITNKFYKWNVTVADGVPSIEVVEV